MSTQKLKSKKDALINIIKSIRQEMRDGIKKRQFEASTVNVSDEVSSIASNDIEKEDNNASNTAPCLLPKELSPRSFLLLFNIDNHNFYVATTLDAKDNIMPQRVYEYLGLDRLRGKKGYVLDDVWGKCKQCYKKINEAWHNEGYEEDEIWRSGDEKTDYDPPYVNIKTFEVKKYSFKGGCSFVCITNREDDTLPLGHVNGARFKAMIRKDQMTVSDVSRNDV
ncbi:hypothetical protein Tco_0535278 [Tanacetum coccineum]